MYKQIIVRLPEEVIDFLKEQAKPLGMSYNAYIRFLVCEMKVKHDKETKEQE